MLGHGATGQFAIGEVVAGATAETITADKWFMALSEPPRFKAGLKASAQTFAAYPPLPVVSFGWFGALPEPTVKTRRALPTPAQQTLAPSPLPFVTFGFYAALTEPVRVPRRLPASEQQSLGFVFAPSTISISWWQPLGDPAVRTLRGLKASEQQAYAGPPRLSPNPTVTGRLDAAESFDVALFAGVTFTQPITCAVGVREITFNAALMSTIEIASASATVGITESTFIPTSGSPVAPSITANVAIIEVRP